MNAKSLLLSYEHKEPVTLTLLSGTYQEQTEEKRRQGAPEETYARARFSLDAFTFAFSTFTLWMSQ